MSNREPLILRDTEHWVAINKPPGVVVHDVPGEKHAGSTLVDWLQTHIPAIKKNFPADDSRPGIVHRLDADTSGVILVAKDQPTLQVIQDQFRARTTQKTYHALVFGDVRQGGELIGNIARTGTDTEHRIKRLSFSWDKHEAKLAETSYQPLSHYLDETGRALTLLELHPKTGRTHQLRVQLTDAGWPIIGDPMYNTKESREASQLLNLKRQFLHAVSVQFSDPATNEPVLIECPLATDLYEALNQLQIDAAKPH